MPVAALRLEESFSAIMLAAAASAAPSDAR
jgi:hypothetical protein